MLERPKDRESVCVRLYEGREWESVMWVCVLKREKGSERERERREVRRDEGSGGETCVC